MKPLQWVALGAAVVMLLLGFTAEIGWWIAVPLMVLSTVLTVADNGLAFTAVAERAGPFWSGRALGIQNTAQFLTSSIVPPLGGAAIGALGFGWTFALAAIFPIVAVPLVPVKQEREVS
jgi:MFS family permease